MTDSRIHTKDLNFMNAETERHRFLFLAFLQTYIIVSLYINIICKVMSFK
jgi:hypothetical protein